MTIWRLTTMNLHELLRRLRAGESRNAIVRAMHVSLHTVAKYHHWAEAHGLFSGPLPDLATLDGLRAQTLGANRPQRHRNESSVELYHAEVTTLLDQGKNAITIWRLLQGRHPQEFGASPSAMHDWDRAALATSFALLLFFSYGQVYSALKGVSLGDVILSRHRTLGPIWMLLLIVGIYWAGW